METPVGQRAQAPAQLPSLPDDVGLNWRPLTPGDVPAWLTLRLAIESHDKTPEHTAEHELVTHFQGSWRDPEHDSIGGFDNTGKMRAYAWVEYRETDSGTLQPSLLGGVHPDDRGRSMGRVLLAWAEARARQLLAATSSTLPARLRVWLWDTQEDVKAIASHAGFSPIRWYTDMHRDLSEQLPDVELTDGVALVPYTADRDEDVRITHNESFVLDHWGSNPIKAEAWLVDISGAQDFRPYWSHVAVDTSTQQIVGYALSSVYKQDWPVQGFRDAWTNVIGVRREYRRRGIAAALLTASMRSFADAGMEYASLGVDTDNPTGAFGLYQNLGYATAESSLLYTKELG